MSSKSTEVKVGIAVILAVIILILGVLWIGEFRLARQWQTYTVYFEEVGGLSAGDPVAVSGLEMGKVGFISLEEDRVRTDLLIEQEVVLREDCAVEIRSIGLMGEKYVYILPGSTGEVLVPGTVLDGEYKSGLPEVAAGMGDIMDEMREAAESLRKVVDTEGGDFSLGTSMARIDTVATELLALLRENRSDVRSTTRTMKKVSGELDKMIAGNKGKLSDGIDSSIAAMERFSAAAARLDTLSLSLKALVTSVESGEGTLGKLIKERKVHDEIEATLDNLNRLIKDIREHPERYLTIELF
jgi:phospholipid/cholesterol/gamma-HCH transport system substrate-binding protein